jgi:erythromycin esterase
MVRSGVFAGAAADGLVRSDLGRAGSVLASAADLDPLLERIGDSQFVLLGEASHGTSEYYLWRSRVTERLVREKGFGLVGVEGDWPDCYRVNRYVKGWDGRTRERGPGTAYEALHAFARWPTWMWANREVVHLAEWLRGWNEERPEEEKVGFYGLDVYSLWESMDAVMAYLRGRDPRLAREAAAAYACFEPYNRDEQEYARGTIGRGGLAWGGRGLVPHDCREEVVQVLRRLRERHAAAPPGGHEPEAAFDAEQNALCAVNAERYYRAMVRGDAQSWNIRDMHMADTLDRLVAYHRTQRERVKAVVWAHNTHIGDARATDMVGEGMVNLGQLVRERHERRGLAGGEGGTNVVLVGLCGHRGSVIAARGWGESMEKMAVPAPMAGSWEDVLHLPDRPNPPGRLILMDTVREREEWMLPRGQRAIGVVYHPRHERKRNYVPTVLPVRYDALIALEETTALRPLHTRVADGEVAETYPSGV